MDLGFSWTDYTLNIPGRNPRQYNASQFTLKSPRTQARLYREGLLSQIATTAAGVAVGHVAGRMAMDLFSGGSEAAPVEQAAPAYTPRDVAPQCQEYSRLFLQCMDQNNNQVGTCQDYMDMMKACQQQHA
ncbi:Mic17p [Paramicrosporidium saccamoebae]|uniref:Mic17p n=1 Tax=Paramicrosporidium saccamoebae TaxID=1246581 RepID=A0A2H9TK27_9FUNG|nr:Mic17p [Paramicrosporidium saccamoebae]